MHDLIIVPGGGLTVGGSVPPWVSNRLDRAMELSAGGPILCLSAATVNKPPPVDETGWPVLEAVAGARYLMARGVDPARILLELASYDTIGNAFFARVMHTDLRGWRRLLIVNSAFHMERTEAIFRWVFGLAPERGYHLAFEAVADAGMTAEDLAFRYRREARSLANVRVLEGRIGDLAELHDFLFTGHDAYAARGALRPRPRRERLERVY